MIKREEEGVLNGLFKALFVAQNKLYALKVIKSSLKYKENR
jgi:hypothetical protein